MLSNWHIHSSLCQNISQNIIGFIGKILAENNNNNNLKQKKPPGLSTLTTEMISTFAHTAS